MKILNIAFVITFATLYLSAQSSSGFMAIFEYGVDRDISQYYHMLPDYGQETYVPNQFLSVHPRSLKAGYYFTRRKWKFSMQAGMMSRSLKEYDYSSGNRPITNVRQYFLGLGAARTYGKKANVKYEYGLDLLGIFPGGLTELADESWQDAFTQNTKVARIYFQGNGDEMTPFFNLYWQALIKLNQNDHRLILGGGINGQVFKTYVFTINAVEFVPGFPTSVFVNSPRFYMWFPFIRVGYEI